MKQRYKQGDNLVAKNLRTKERFQFKCPKDGMCKQMLTRYCIIKLEKGEGTDKFLFVKQDK